MKMTTQIAKVALDVIARNRSLASQVYEMIDQVQGYLKNRACQNAISEIEQHVRVPKGVRVQRGPFAGTLFPVTEITSVKELLPQVLGSYEAELHTALERLFENNYQQIINVGAGWGYYCVGLARCFPDVEIHAFEMDEQRRAVCQQVAELNGVSDQLMLHGVCDTAELKNVLPGENGLLVVDCEGYERELLCPDKIDGFQNVDLLVEIHDHHAQGPTTGEILCDRFRQTHEITSINPQPKDPDNYPELESVKRFFGKHLLEEGRVYSTGWLCLCSKQRTS